MSAAWCHRKGRPSRSSSRPTSISRLQSVSAGAAGFNAADDDTSSSALPGRRSWHVADGGLTPWPRASKRARSAAGSKAGKPGACSFLRQRLRRRPDLFLDVEAPLVCSMSTPMRATQEAGGLVGRPRRLVQRLGRGGASGRAMSSTLERGRRAARRGCARARCQRPEGARTRRFKTLCALLLLRKTSFDAGFWFECV